jgi:hypothetical protein
VNNKYEHRTFFRAVLISIALLAFCKSQMAYCQSMSVSIPSLHLASKERVVGFELHITSGRIAQLLNTPIGWRLYIDNDPSWDTTVKGSLIVGAAALDAKFFEHFLVVEKDESLGIPFDITGEVIVSKDFVSESRIKVGLKDCAITPLKAKHH